MANKQETMQIILGLTALGDQIHSIIDRFQSGNMTDEELAMAAAQVHNRTVYAEEVYEKAKRLRQGAQS